MDTISLLDFATEIDARTTFDANHIAPDEPRTTAELQPEECPDCGEKHIPRRIVCCVDGTWMLEDGAEGNRSKEEPAKGQAR